MLLQEVVWGEVVQKTENTYLNLKKVFICHIESPLKFEKCFLFHVKSSFRS